MFLEYVNMTLVACVATFVATLLFSQKIKDFFAGVPAELRANLSSLERGVKADVQAYQAALIAKISHANIPTTATPPEPPKAA